MSDHDSNVARGHKANLSNPNTSDESKEHSKEVIASMDDDKSSHAKHDGGSSGDMSESRILGGHKANLSNPNTSEESKEHSKGVLEEAGAA